MEVLISAVRTFAHHRTEQLRGGWVRIERADGLGRVGAACVVPVDDPGYVDALHRAYEAKTPLRVPEGFFEMTEGDQFREFERAFAGVRLS